MIKEKKEKKNSAKNSTKKIYRRICNLRVPKLKFSATIRGNRQRYIAKIFFFFLSPDRLQWCTDTDRNKFSSNENSDDDEMRFTKMDKEPEIAPIYCGHLLRKRTLNSCFSAIFHKSNFDSRLRSFDHPFSFSFFFFFSIESFLRCTSRRRK